MEHISESEMESKVELSQGLAEKMYMAVRSQHRSLDLLFAGQPLPDGSVPDFGTGVTLLPSLIEMTDLGRLISLVLNSWIQSGTMPTAQQLHSSAESMEVDGAVFITTLYCTAMLGAFLPVICSGDLDTVISILRLTTSVEEQPVTSPNTYSKRPQMRLNGVSTTEKQETTSRSSRSQVDAADGNSTNGKRRSRSRKPKQSKKKQRSRKKSNN